MNLLKIPLLSNASLCTKARLASAARKLPWVTGVFMACLWAQLAFGSALSDLANSMQPGTWAKLTTNNSSVIIKPNGGDIFEYSNRGAWDPIHRQLYFCGASHHGSFYNDCVRYDEDTNSWASIGVPPGICKDNCPADNTVINYYHGYDQNAFDTKRGVFYFRVSAWLYQYNTNDATWSKTPNMPGNCGDPSGIAEILEYFPDIDRIVYLSPYCTTGAVYYNPDTNSWSEPPAALPNGGYSLQGAYSKDGYLYGGCGSTAQNSLSRVDKNGNWQKVANTPAICLDAYSLLVGDPASGRLLFFPASGPIYELNSQGSTWSNTNISSQFPSGGSAIIAPVSNHGVVIMAKTINSQTQVEVWLYKHALSTSTTTSSTSDTTPPSTPANVSASAVSSSQINVSWTTSTDNVGVADYILERCQGSTCTNLTQISTLTGNSYIDTAVTANTTYNYRVRARDAAGNLSSYSTIVSTTTLSSSVAGGSDFATRCSQPGVIRCVGFDSAADLGGNAWGYRVGYGTQDGSACNSGSGSTQRRCPTIDTNVKASGTGSARFDVPVGAPGSLAGAWWANFTDDLSTNFGGSGNFTYYIQLRMRYTQSFINAGNWKAHWVTTAGDKPGCSASNSTNCQSSCTDIELVVQTNTPAWGFPSMYSGCPGAFSMTVDDTLSGGSDFNFQNARPSPYCLYSQLVAGKQFPPTGNCFPYVADEWMTYSYKIHMGPRGTSGEGNCKGSSNFTNCYYNNDIQMRMGREGQPTQPVITWTGGINAGTVANDLQYGKIWIMPYSGSATFSSGGTMWVDEVIISRQPIADPGTSQSAKVPVAPTGLTIK
jgi:Fibronectin type III domain